MKMAHRTNCDCVECEWSRTYTAQIKEKKREVARKVRKNLGIQYRRETLGRLVEDGLNSIYYSDHAKTFLSVNENVLEWLHIQITNAQNAQERWKAKHPPK